MPAFPWVNFFIMFVSTWVALSPRCRTTDVKKNWWIFRINLCAAAINAFGVLFWVYGYLFL